MAGRVTLFFRSVPIDLSNRIRRFGALERSPGHWVYAPRLKGVLLEIHVHKDVGAYERDLALYAYESWRRFIEQSVDWEPNAFLNINVAQGQSARRAAREFVLSALEEHDGVVVCSNSNHGWTVDEIRDGKRIHGLFFLEGPARAENRH